MILAGTGSYGQLPSFSSRRDTARFNKVICHSVEEIPGGDHNGRDNNEENIHFKDGFSPMRQSIYTFIKLSIFTSDYLLGQVLSISIRRLDGCHLYKVNI